MTAFLEWADRNPAIHGGVVAGVIILMAVVAFREWRRADASGTTRTDWIWGVGMLAILVAGRWPSFFYFRQLSEDESQLMAGAHAIAHHPFFWRSVNSATAGPLDFFALLPAGGIFGWDTYLTARLTAVALIATSLFLLYLCMARLFGRRIGRMAVLPAVCFEALTNAPDFLHYSTELVAMTLLAGAAYLAAVRWTGKNPGSLNVIGGALLGAVPFAKLQGAPLAAAMGLGWLLAEMFSKTPNRAVRVASLMGGALGLGLLVVFYVTLTDDWHDFYVSTILYNLHYANLAPASVADTLLDTLGYAVLWDSLLHLWLSGMLLGIAALWSLRPPADRLTTFASWIGLGAVVIAAYCILTPRRPFLHYWQFLVLPLTFLAGALLFKALPVSTSLAKPRARLVAVTWWTGLIGMLLLMRVVTPAVHLGQLAFFQKKPRTELAQRVLAHAHAGERIAIWGWSNYIYVETGLRQATHDAHIGTLFETGELQTFFRERYLADLTQSLPETFLDSVGPASLRYDTPQFQPEESFPELAATIRAHYVLVETTQRARIYRRQDLVNP